MGFSTIEDPPPLSMKITSDAPVLRIKGFQHGLGRANGFLVGYGMATAKIAKAPHL